MRRLACLVSLSLLCASPLAAAPAQPAFDIDIERMVVDKDISIAGVQLACTGVGDTRNDPKWAGYPIRVEFSDARNEYMVDALVALLDAKGKPVLVVRCDGPWLLIKPPAGTYAVHAQLMDSAAKSRSARFTVPAHGQKRVVLQFPDA